MTVEAPQLTGLTPQTFLLGSLELFNWGPFQGRHRAEFDQRGTAVIGPTGSGKTTLVDAFMTLICAQPRYNLASTGGHESDRDLMSYVRGVIGAGNEGDTQDHIVRRGATVTAIAANFSNGDRELCIVALLWLDSNSSALADLKRIWVIVSAPAIGLDELLEIQQKSAIRGLKQFGRKTPGVEVFDSKKSYLARLRGRFEVGDNAFTLLNRAAGLKQLNSVDELFRELVLDDSSAFVRAAEVAAEFDDLAIIRSELESARLQQQSLHPLSNEYVAYQKCGEQLEHIRLLLRVSPIWYASHACRLLKLQEECLEQDLQELEIQLNDLTKRIDVQKGHTENLRDLYMQTGGADIDQLKQQLSDRRDNLGHCRRRADEYLSIVKALQFDPALTEAALTGNQRKARELSLARQTEFDEKRSAAYEAGALHHENTRKVEGFTLEIEEAANNDSNIPQIYRRFRDQLANRLGIGISDLPFVAELIEVKEDQQKWRAAIERAIGSHRLRVMVPDEVTHEALSWVNARHNELHVRLLQVKSNYSPAKFLDDGFTRKLNFKSHPHREALKNLLAAIDRHCVIGPEQLRTTPHGMTAEGLMSGTSGRFDKPDQRRLDQDWMTGFDNRDRLAQLASELQQAQAAMHHSESKLQQAESAYAQAERDMNLLGKLENYRFADIDVPGITARIGQLNERLLLIEDPNSETAKAEQRWESAKQQLEKFQADKESATVSYRVAEKEIKSARHQRADAFIAAGEGLPDEEQGIADDYFPVPELNSLNVQKQDAVTELNKAQSDCQDKRSSHESQLVRLMGNARKVDTGALVEVGTELEDLPEYIERLRVLTEEALPEKLARFKKYLNHSSDQGVTQLLRSVDSEVDRIRFRIEELNKTMTRVDFQPGRYLRLNPQPVVHESLQTLQKAQRHLRYAELQDDDGEQHYKALQTLVEIIRDASERRRTRGAQALLDPRYRLQFSISIIDRANGAVVETRTGSQGGSGGEKEIIASYILTASLSYALCPEGATQPLFGTVVLDEAFSKSSQVVAGRIITALREFGLHPLLITPNKEIKLLSNHTNSAVLVHNRGGRNASMTNMSWEQLEKHAEKKRVLSREIS
ncbi:MAG: AAA family ATPase [Gammaproteobacteria bacterium]|nr:AAA family ATPase [Gammaproteobacteria bacterium]